MPTSGEAIYLDSSALVKLVIQEGETPALTRYLAGHPTRVSSGIAKVEVVRAVRRQSPAAVARARQVLARVELLALDDQLLDDAARLEPPVLRSLDAVHLASALSLGADLRALVAYDQKLIEAATNLGIAVESPGVP